MHALRARARRGVARAARLVRGRRLAARGSRTTLRPLSRAATRPRRRYNAHAPANMRADALAAIEALQREGYDALGAEVSVVSGDQQKMEVCMQS